MRIVWLARHDAFRGSRLFQGKSRDWKKHFLSRWIRSQEVSSLPIQLRPDRLVNRQVSPDRSPRESVHFVEKRRRMPRPGMREPSKFCKTLRRREPLFRKPLKRLSRRPDKCSNRGVPGFLAGGNRLLFKERGKRSSEPSIRMENDLRRSNPLWANGPESWRTGLSDPKESCPKRPVPLHRGLVKILSRLQKS